MIRPKLPVAGTDRRWWVLLLTITLLGLAVRVWYILVFRQDVIGNVLPNGDSYVSRVWGDGLVFHKQANLLADGEGLISPLPFELQGIRQQSADHPPVYTLFLTFFSWLGIRSEVGHMLVSAPLGALTAVVFGLLGRRVAGPTVGLIAAVFGAFDPNIWPYPGFILSETVTIPLAALLAWSCYRLWETPSFREATLVGLALGLSILARAELAMVAVIAVVPFIALLRGESVRRRVGLLTTTAVMSALLVLPWSATTFNGLTSRCICRSDSTIRWCRETATRAIATTCSATTGFVARDERSRAPGSTWPTRPWARFASREVALTYISEHPKRAVQAVAARVGRVTGVYRPLQQARLNAFIAGREPWVANSAILLYYPTALLALAGGSILRRRGVPILPLVGLVATSLIAVAMTLAVLRYRASAQPALAVLAAVAIDHLWRLGRRAISGDTETSQPVGKE